MRFAKCKNELKPVFVENLKIMLSALFISNIFKSQ